VHKELIPLNSELRGDLQPSSFKGLCGVVVTYYPSGDVQQRLKTMAELVDKLVIIDNSADAEVLSTLTQIADQHGALVIANRKNLGVATALNQGVAYAQKLSVEWVLFFDQDSRPIGKFRQELHQVLSEYVGRRPLGIIGCNYIVAGKASIMFPIPLKQLASYVHVNSVITSGSMHRVEMFNKIGLFRDEYFIDLVDIEYCWRATRYGYAILRTTEPLMEHAWGQVTEHTILGYKVVTTNHSAFRRYFMARNTVFLTREYFVVYPIKVIKIVFLRCMSTILMCLLEKEKGKKFRYTASGLWHGLLGKTGATPELFN